jgi:hypothetical protein
MSQLYRERGVVFGFHQAWRGEINFARGGGARHLPLVLFQV